MPKPRTVLGTNTAKFSTAAAALAWLVVLAATKFSPELLSTGEAAMATAALTTLFAVSARQIKHIWESE